MKQKEYQKKLAKLGDLTGAKRRVLLITHKRPDGDAAGSTLALKFYWESLGKKADVRWAGEMDEALNYLPGFKQDFFLKDGLTPEDLKKYDLVILADAADLKRTGLFDGRLEEAQEVAKDKLVILDHHVDETNEESKLAITRKDKAATSLIVYDYLREIKATISSDMATNLLTGIFTDTGGFMHANTNSEIMEIASDLMRRGAPLSQIAKKNFANKKVNTLKIWGRAFARASLNQKSKMAFSYVTKKDLEECGACVEDLSGVTNVLGSAEESAYSLLLAETKDEKVKGSLRSEEYKNCDVSKIAKNFGGGGHRLASGFEFKGKIVGGKGKAAVS